MDKTVLDGIILGRIEPQIYAFTTNTIPNYLKVGDTYRPVSVRLKEWQEHFPQLEKQYEGTAKINDDVYFRDFSVHQFLETDRRKVRLLQADIPSDVYYSREFFKDATATDVEDAISDIEQDYANHAGKYQFYNAEDRSTEAFTYARTENYPLRPNQKKTVAAFKKARKTGHKNLLMYAVMRFGKSFTSMCCAVAMKANLVLIVSAKADVRQEWKKTVESHIKFEKYDFIESEDLARNNHIITEKLSSGRRVAVFLTLQDLQGETIKDKHSEIFGRTIDLLLVDETHFGARAEKYGAVLKDVKDKRDNDFVDQEEADEIIKTLSVDTTIHLSGTPYRILMGSEFKKEDIIAFYQFADIVQEQEQWDKKHILDDKYKEWDNPYFGFPQMVRFAFLPNESARNRLAELKSAGTTYAFSALLKPQSVKKEEDGSHKKFQYEQEVLDLLEVIDGSKADDQLLGFLDYEKIKNGKMCRHIVVVLPYRASCDAMEALIANNKDKFRNLGEYQVINISGVDNPNAYKTSETVKSAVLNAERDGQKTITLTVNRMLTGSTVPQWDTMLYLKDTASPQEYDQAIFRLQNQFVRTYVDENGDTIKYNMKPQTLLVDFMPDRMFAMQEAKSKIYNANVDTGGNRELERRMEEELRISPIVTVNADKMVEVVASDILQAVSNYQKDKGIMEEARVTPVDLGILDDETIRAAIEKENEIGSNAGLSISAHEGTDDDEGTDLDIPEGEADVANGDETDEAEPAPEPTEEEKRKQENSWKNKIQSYYVRILLFAYITKDRVISVSDIIDKMDTEENRRIAKNLGLSKQVLSLLNAKSNKFVLSDLDYKIQDLNDLSHSTEMSPEERASVAVKKFGKLGDAIVITPAHICDNMVSMLPDDFLREIAARNGRILDIAGTSGEYALALQKKLLLLGIEKDVVADMVYTIPKSSICYELTRKLYEMLGLNVANIARQFVATDLLGVKTDDEKIDNEKIVKIITQDKPFDEIKLTDEPEQGETDMIQFDAVVGNPPYQGIAADTSEPAIYHHFVDISYQLSHIACMITPAKFLFNAGKTPKEWNQRMLHDEHLEVIFYEPDNTKVFPETGAKGGIAITYRDENQTFGQIGTFTAYPELNSILHKVVTPGFESIKSLVFAPESYRLSKKLHKDHPEIAPRLSNGHTYDVTTNIFSKLGGVVFDECPNDEKEYVQLIGLNETQRVYKWIQRDYLDSHRNLDCYKIIIPKSNGSGAIGEVLSTPLIGEPLIGHTQTFISIGAFETLFEAQAAFKYIKTKFARALLGTLKVTQDNKKDVWTNVPLQDFTAESDIDWLKSISEIDRQLYAKYRLDESEIAFIESMIKPME